MSFDKQNFARTVQQQQAGISPQMWPIICPDNGYLSPNTPYEISINPCDSIWLPATFDKSYGTNPIQSDPTYGQYYPNPTLMGCNMYEVARTTPNPGATYTAMLIDAPVFSLRFNSPNNPWMLWGLGNGFASPQPWGEAAANMTYSIRSTMMRSITGPISRLWIQYYLLGGPDAGGNRVGFNQIVLLSMLGFSQASEELNATLVDPGGVLTSPPTQFREQISCGAYRTTDLNSADLAIIGEAGAAAPTVTG